MGMRFLAETIYRRFMTGKPEQIAATIAQLLSSPNGTILVSDDDGHITGMIGVLIFDHPFSGERTASDVAWWVDPEARGHGIRLLHAAEEWARENGAKNMVMVAPDTRVGGIYARLGYTPIELSYQKGL